MPLEFRKVLFEGRAVSLDLDLTFCQGILLGVTGPAGSGVEQFLRLAGGDLTPDSGEVTGAADACLVYETMQSTDPCEIRAAVERALRAKPGLLAVGPALALLDPGAQSLLLSGFRGLAEQEATVVLASQDLALMERHCDEVLVLEQGRAAGRGDPAAVLRAWRERLVRSAQEASPPLPMVRRPRPGDGRARILSLYVLDSQGRETSRLQSGEAAAVRVRVRYEGRVDEPEVGILIQSRIGVNVYGTNTGLEQVRFGPVEAGDEVEIRFSFDCNLCPNDYTITAASHDPDGTAHEWLDAAQRFTVDDNRHTAGVANLRARVEVNRGGEGA